MGAIGSIRKRSGLLIGVVGVAMLAFILTDFFTKSESRGIKTVGEVNGEVISPTFFESKVDQNTENYKTQSGVENITSNISYQIKENTWEELVKELVLATEYERLGLTVTVEEVDDMLRGRFIHPYVRQNFTDPSTGVFDPQSVTNVMAQLDQDPELKKQWDALVDYIESDRLFQKYQTLVSKAYYVPKAFAERDYFHQNTTAEIELIALKYASISDSLVALSDEDYEAFYEENKYRYIQDKEVRSFDFVIFDVLPSDADRKAIDEEVNTLLAELDTLEENEDIISFVNAQSDEFYDSSWVKRDELIPEFDSLFNLKTGEAIGPFILEDVYHYGVLLEKEARPDSLNAAHILIAYQGAYRVAPEVSRSQEEAEKMADSLLQVVKGLDSLAFANIAQEISDDQSVAENGGYFGWFPDGMMVSAFNEACVNKPVGSYNVVETAFGYHIIKVIDKTKAVDKIRYAHFEKAILPSSETDQDVYSKAIEFASKCSDIASFDKTVTDKGLSKRSASNLYAMDFSIPGLEDGRQFVKWAYSEDMEVGTLSAVMSDEDKYVVAILTSIIEEGTIPLELIKEDLKPLVMIEKKATMLEEKIKNSGATTIEQMAQKLAVQIDTLPSVTYANYSLPGYGPEPKIVGTVFASKAGQTTKTIKGNAAVFVVKVKSFNEAAPLDNYMPIVMQKEGFFKSRVEYDLYNSLKKSAEIIDNRIYFY